MSCTSMQFHGKGKGKDGGKGKGKGKGHDDYDEIVDYDDYGDYYEETIDDDVPCNAEVLKKCGDDIANYCSEPSDAPEDWLKRCIHDYYRISFSADCVEAIFRTWDIIKKDQKFDDNYEPMASDIFSILECKKDDKDQKTHNGEHHNGWHSKSYKGSGGKGEDNHRRTRRLLGHLLLLMIVCSFAVCCCLWYKMCLNKRRQSSVAAQQSSVAAQQSSVAAQQSSIVAQPMYPVINNERKMQHSIQAVPDTSYIPLSTHV